MSSRQHPCLLDVVSSVSSVPGSPNQFTVKITRDWCTQHSVLGGFLTAIMLAAGQRFLDQELGAARYPDPVHAFVQFLHMAHPGPSIITCTLLRVSSKHCVIQVELARAPTSTEDLDSLPVATLGIFTYGDIRKEKGLSQESRSTITRPPPDRRTECVTINDPVVYATPVTAKMNWVAPRSPDGLWGHRLGGHNRELWLSFRDGSRLSDILHLAYLSDLPLQPPATHIPDFYTKYAISTLCLSIEFKRRPDPSTEWVMIRSNSNKVSNGRYDAALQLFDEKNNLLALSHHVVFTSDLKPRPARM
ncbi:hypothetical protein BO94DRAFT_456481 [Aspergillus sclerotioniger CBS 115572]|uniref:Thioesterase family protein n=1 Tax=Aspergillus sclerotioniger CBS 115572 TaxID=1450535 RepID=A0A317XBD5_9EURO|nr:hypothetical protein BO94DRAFT_456481 [Aspergillus sclerotioniger CBS 115572]PWY94917.1 hypothetical protein BO94DRAFT_456481 [Aspergillus sclerotioniger CBS 115572]